ncbi:MAG: hypothetical protein HYS21_05025 [Deltaproteobacteria bacterium]|nr:hypothetical protein [Deltaproteobacteria bacterium]
MTPKDHLILGTAASIAMYPIMGVESLFFWGASFAIDIDHYLDYIYHNGFTDLSIKGMFAYHKALERVWYSPEFLNIEIFHTIEFIVPLYIFSYAIGSSLLTALCLGLIFHVALDMVFLQMKGIFFVRAYSFTEYFLRKRRLENMGYRPVEIYNEAVRIVRES